MKEINEAQNWVFQLANAFLFLSYASRDLLMLRVVLMLAGFCFVMWGSVVLTKVAIDTIVWNSIFCIINAARAAELAWQRRPVKFEREEHEHVYREVFEPVGIGRLQYKLLMQQSLLRSLREGSTFIEAGNEATNLTLIYSGRMCILSAPKDGRPSEKVGSVCRMQFVESPQWANMQVQRDKKTSADRAAANSQKGRSQSLRFGTQSISTAALPRHDEDTIESTSTATDEIVEMDAAIEDVRAASTVEVTFKAETDVQFFTWPMERLVDYLAKTPSLSAPLNSIVGSDVATKLFSQAKSSEGEALLDRRIYLPLDEPQEVAVIPLEDDHNTSNEVQYAAEIEEGKESVLLSVQRKPVNRRNSIIAEMQWLEQRGAEDTALDRQLAAILRERTSLNKYEISALLSKGRWRHILRGGTVLIREGELTTFLGMLLSGSLSVSKERDGKICQLHMILPGQLVGSIELLETETEHIAGETATSLEPVVFISWDTDDLRALLAPRPRLRAQMTTLVAIDLAAKFRQVEDMV
mmetsp:Transcript_35429/g.77692  ORF Transcript_35429/g.77692 Transcript_35429/m.77692 type:complete len:525 (-) Transcript_35429:12-1586(-)